MKNKLLIFLLFHLLLGNKLIAENLVNNYFPNNENRELGEIYLPDNAQRKLPLGVYLRFKSK